VQGHDTPEKALAEAVEQEHLDSLTFAASEDEVGAYFVGSRDGEAVAIIGVLETSDGWFPGARQVCIDSP
jgi:hypothetical protein